MRSQILKRVVGWSVVVMIYTSGTLLPTSLLADEASRSSLPGLRDPFLGNDTCSLPPGVAPQHFNQPPAVGSSPNYQSQDPMPPAYAPLPGFAAQAPDHNWVPPAASQNSTSACQPAATGRSIFDHFDVFGGLDGSKQPQDFGVNALFGGRVAVNAGWFLDEKLGLGLQAATSLNVSDNAVQVFEAVGGSTHRVQSYSTLALYQRTPAGFNWGFGFDLLRENYYDQFLLGQWRGKAGYLFTKTDEVGAWATIPQIDDQGSFAGLIPVTLKPIQQTALFWTHQWEFQGFTTVWAGYSRRHGEVNLALGDLDPVTYRPTFGAELHIPLNDHCALFGQANFLSPFDTGTVDSFLGITFYPGGGARCAPNHRSTPVLPVVNNTMFSTDLRR